MSVDTYQRRLQAHHKTLAALHKQRGVASSRAATETQRANAMEAAAARMTPGGPNARSKLSGAKRHRASAASAQKKVGELDGKIARETERLTATTKALTAAQRAADQQRSQDHALGLAAIDGRLASHDTLHQVALAAIEKLQQLPETITVLFLASNPAEASQLRLDEEARAITQRLRMSKHRDTVQVVSHWAVRTFDVLQALNEVRPHVVHFSGHGSAEGELVLQDDTGRAKLVTTASIAAMIASTSWNTQFVFFNACYSSIQAEAVVEHVPAAIGMNTAIGDEAARVFAGQFYSAIGFGLSVQRAFDQARALVMAEGIPEEDTPELFVTEGLDPDALVLVRPAGEE